MLTVDRFDLFLSRLKLRLLRIGNILTYLVRELGLLIRLK